MTATDSLAALEARAARLGLGLVLIVHPGHWADGLLAVVRTAEPDAPLSTGLDAFAAADWLTDWERLTP